MSHPLESYALIGDCETAALVGKNGSVDWLCLPRFDSGACFAALLGTEEHGRWSIAPNVPIHSTRRCYRDDTLILETEHSTASGRVTVTDFMPVRQTAADLIRIVEGRAGTVPMTMDLRIRFDYGASVPWVRRADHFLLAIAGPDALHLHSPVPTFGEGFSTRAHFEVREGDRLAFDLNWFPSHQDPPGKIDPFTALSATESWWRRWTSTCKTTGPWAADARRSLVTLKALTYAPTGGILAAPTTSLPERLGGVRNWDYRYCWLRDATFTLYALVQAGYLEEARAWREWLLRAVAGRPDQIQLMYGLGGERRLPEMVLPWLPGFADSRPVRIGNAAHTQHQLDVFGELLDALSACWRAGIAPAPHAWEMERAVVEFLESVWTEPDEGIWEVRGPRRDFTHSKMMAWVALDRAVKGIETFGLAGPLERWRGLRTQIHQDVCRRGFNPERGAFVQYYDSDRLDASLLMMPLVGFLSVSDPRVAGTIAAIERELVEGGFVHRYQGHEAIDGLPPGEAAFLLCTFWLADVQKLQGRDAEAVRTFERVLAVRNDVGLLSESYDPQLGRLLGNFPQAFSHVGLVNTARNLSVAHGPAEDRPSSRQVDQGSD